MTKRTIMSASLALAAVAGVPGALAEDGVLIPGDQITLSTNLGGNAIKSKLVRLVYPQGDGFEHVLVCVYSDSVGPDVWTYKGATFGAQDVFATRSTDDGQTWSTPVNISNTALLSSMDADHDGLPETPPIPYHGDSEKPNIFNVGSTVVVTWVDRYAPGGTQRSAIYPEFGEIEMPYACVYECRSTDGGLTWSEPRRLSDGYRDAKQDVNKGSTAGWVITWQEDPQGLRPGQAEGPGEGGSGATVSKGTDIWWTSLATTPLRAGEAFPDAQRLTDNFTMMGQGSNEGYEYGQHGASRANLALQGGTAIVAYEETKGLQGLDDGKYVRYHVFSAFDDSMPDPTAGAGWIVSKPDENARRVRFVAQGTPGPESGIKLFMFYKQGQYDQGGPSDILGRVGIGGLMPENLVPPVAANPTTREIAFGNTPALNLSSTDGLEAGTDDNPFEDARAHRALIDGDFVAIGWSYTPDWAIARYTDLENYDFWLRRSFDGGATWDEPTNLSNLEDTSINVKEPRLIKTPNSPDPSEPRDPNTFIVGWGTELNGYEHLGLPPVELDIVVTRTTNRGETWAVPVPLAEGPANQYESQIRCTPDGETIHAVWQDRIGETTTVEYRSVTHDENGISGDLNGDGLVDGEDLGILLGQWGPCLPKSACEGDITGDGLVDGADIGLWLNFLD